MVTYIGSNNVLFLSVVDPYFDKRENKRPDGLTSSDATSTLGSEIGPLGHIIEIQLKVPQKARKTRMMRNLWNIFEKMTEELNYDPFRGSKWRENWLPKPIFDTPIKVAQIDIYIHM